MKSDGIKKLIVQAGGLGVRMGKYTKNKNKCLIPYQGKTIIHHLLDIFTDVEITIIVDYKRNLLINYVHNILNRKDVKFVTAHKKSTSASLIESTKEYEKDEPFIYVWSDLVFFKKPIFDFVSDIFVGTTNDFECRWSIQNDKLVNVVSSQNGVMGLFAFRNKSVIADFDEELSLVGGNLSKKENNISYSNITDVIEIGTECKYNELLSKDSKCRFFNKISIKDNTIVKECINKEYSNLIESELEWYNTLRQFNINFIPRIISTNPLTMSKINGVHPFEKKFSYIEKRSIIENIMKNLHLLHNLNQIKSIQKDVTEIYYNKTFQRVYSVKSVIPFFDDYEICINDQNFLNPFSELNLDLFQKNISSINVEHYNIIHGDPTFSNTLVTNNLDTIFIDPRGYFGNTKVFGDKNYDWAKLFYSVDGNYDSINSKKFSVDLHNEKVSLSIESSEFENFSDMVLINSNMSYNLMYLYQSLIWFSLTGYVKEDIDSILYSFYKGIVYWNKHLSH
jgi:GTP:adenosylcobinamide-phosphate guanylyltransferase